MPVSLGTALLAVLFVAEPVPSASSQVTGLPSPPAACTSPEYRQFDFWVGEWTVTNARGQFAGENHVTLIQGGCAVEESWTGADGGSGTSVNGYFDGDRKWHQTWLDSRGGRLDLAGGLVGGKIGNKVLHQITWEKRADGRVRQIWQSSPDGGSSWKVVFDGTYVRTGATGTAQR